MVTVGIDANEKMGLEKQADTKMDAAKETLLIQMPQKKFAIASAETKSTYNLVCVARNTGDLNQEKRLRRKLCRQLQQDRDNEWTSRANKFEKVWEDKNPRKAYVPLKQYSGKMKRCSPVLSITSGVAVGEAILPIRWNHFKTLLNRKTPSALGLGPICAVNEEIFHLLDTDQNQRPSRIREITKIIHSIWIDERIPDSWRDAIIIPLYKKLSVTDPRNYRGISLLHVMYMVLERIILDQLVKHREETTRVLRQQGNRNWQRYSKPMQLALLDFEAAFHSFHRGRLLNALRAEGVPGKFVRLLDDMNQHTTAAVRTPAGCTTPFEMVTGVR
ncbi:hypothetical protein RB195_021754 [Necator americanus]|uniref:Reverse transcriptase domain-containing protein n=1 Tax=Necator americanus TaxID=51031 RepID=A0ABR1ECJ7_NECAM